MIHGIGPTKSDARSAEAPAVQRADRSRFESPVQETNRALARQINQESLSDPASPYAGKCIGIVNGSVEVVAGDIGQVVRTLQSMGADPKETLVFEASVDYDTPQKIWTTF